MAKEVRQSLDEVLVHFAALEDPRSEVNRLHPLSSVVVIAIMAVLAGASGPTGIAKWAVWKADLLKKHLALLTEWDSPQRCVSTRAHGFAARGISRVLFQLAGDSASRRCQGDRH